MNPTSVVENHDAAQSGAAQYLTFALGKEEYAVEILRVQEIKGWSAVTPIPNSPAYVKGVMNLRGTVVPILDLRIKLGLDAPAYDRFTVIVVVTVGSRVVGLVVDAVSDVLDLPEAEIERDMDLGAHVDTRTLSGIARHENRLITLLNIDTVVGGELLAA